MAGKPVNNLVKIIVVAGVVGVGLVYFYAGGVEKSVAADDGSAGDAQSVPMVKVKLPDELSAKATMGKRAFVAKCAVCHGENAAGQDGVAPPLVHKIYEPSHHSDEAFVLAAKNGVRSHHWKFGAMPPVEGLTRGDVLNIAAYVRELQRENNIR